MTRRFMKKKILKPRRKLMAPKECSFCKENKTPEFSDVETLQHFLTERGKIIARSRNGLCAKHQRTLTLNVKYARHLALLPFTSRD
jgi:small subunit ribosomal protein S18